MAVDNNISLTYIVNSVLNQMDSDDRDFARLYQIGVTGLRELWFDVSGDVKTVALPRKANNTVDLPSDYANWSKIGVMNDHGKVYTLTINKSITLYNDTASNRVVSSGAFIDAGFVKVEAPNYYNFWLNGLNYNLYGLGGSVSSVGFCNVDEANGIIVLGSEVKQDEIILEYIVDPVKCECDVHAIHVFCQQALEDYIYWKAIDKKMNVPANEKARARREYYNQKRLARARIKTFRIGEAIDTSRRNVMLAPKL